MPMKKILMVCEAFGGGVFSYVTQLCNDLCDTYEISLAYAVRPQTPEDYRACLDSRIRLFEVKSFGKLTNPIAVAKTIRELRSINHTVNPDVIHLHSSIAGGIGRLAFNGKDKAVVYTPHGYAFILMGSGLKSTLYRLVEQILGKRNAVTLTCCESEDEVARSLCKRTAYIETGVSIADLDRALNPIKPFEQDKFTVYTLGRACVQKQPALFNRIAELVPEARFLWVGGGELESVLTASNIEVTGWKPRNEALAIGKGADAFILCSLGEAIAMSLIENMYMKKLILVSNVMGNKSVINDGINGYVCNTPEDYALKIRQSMMNYPSELPENAYDDVLSIYNTAEMKRKYVDFYNGLINGKRNEPIG